jgi:hypothetical protein
VPVLLSRILETLFSTVFLLTYITFNSNISHHNTFITYPSEADFLLVSHPPSKIDIPFVGIWGVSAIL